MYFDGKRGTAFTRIANWVWGTYIKNLITEQKKYMLIHGLVTPA